MTQYNKIYCLGLTCEFCMYLTSNRRISYYTLPENRRKKNKQFWERAAAAADAVVATFFFLFSSIPFALSWAAHIMYIHWLLLWGRKPLPETLEICFLWICNETLERYSRIQAQMQFNCCYLFVYFYFFHQIDISRTFI